MIMRIDQNYFDNIKDRMWRKNRQLNENTTCHGTDLNRNWDYHFGG